MSWWRRVFGGNSEHIRPKRIDYLTEALALERQGDFDAALTSYRLALRDQPNDPRILQNMAIAFSKTGQLDDAVRTLQELAMESGTHGILITRHAPGRYTAALSDQVPFGMTRELVR